MHRIPATQLSSSPPPQNSHTETLPASPSFHKEATSTPAPSQKSIELYKKASPRATSSDTPVNTQTPIADPREERKKLWGEAGKSAVLVLLMCPTIGLQIGIGGIFVEMALIMSISLPAIAVGVLGFSITCLLLDAFVLDDVYKNLGERLGITLEKQFPPSKTNPT